MRKNVQEILDKEANDTIWFFDFDGTLTVSRFGNKCSFVNENMNFLEYCIHQNPYENAKPVEIMQQFIAQLPPENVYLLGQSNNTLENRHKIQFMHTFYPDVKDENMIFVNSKEAKLIVMTEFKKLLGKDNLVLVEDNYDTILMAEAKYNIRCYHISSFL